MTGMLQNFKMVVAGLTELGLMLLALAIVCALLVGGNVPFFGSVTANIIALVKDLGSNGLVGLIALGFILWLFSNRSMA
jgi:ABC-type enterochelin transport system permease subunit